MKNLENYGVLEMNANEIRETDGGGWLKRLKKIGKYIGVYDAIDDFVEGWNSVEPAC